MYSVSACGSVGDTTHDWMLIERLPSRDAFLFLCSRCQLEVELLGTELFEIRQRSIERRRARHGLNYLNGNTMGRNDWHVTDDGRLAQGLVTKRELSGVLSELDDANEAGDIAEALAKRLQTLKDKELPMLTGKGFIVVDPKNPRFAGEEFKTVEEAQAEGSNIAYQSGVAIVYAPVAVLRPKRDLAISTPSDLLKQLSTPTGKPLVEIPAPDAEG